MDYRNDDKYERRDIWERVIYDLSTQQRGVWVRVGVCALRVCMRYVKWAVALSFAMSSSESWRSSRQSETGWEDGISDRIVMGGLHRNGSTGSCSDYGSVWAFLGNVLIEWARRSDRPGIR